jgi:hypothetical protein
VLVLCPPLFKPQQNRRFDNQGQFNSVSHVQVSRRYYHDIYKSTKKNVNNPNEAPIITNFYLFKSNDLIRNQQNTNSPSRCTNSQSSNHFLTLHRRATSQGLSILPNPWGAFGDFPLSSETKFTNLSQTIPSSPSTNARMLIRHTMIEH